MIKSGIYAILNLLNGKRYIGGTVNLKGRRKGHFYALRKGIHENPHLQNAFNKYDENTFGWMILEYVEDIRMLKSKENIHLSIFWPTGLLYNRCPMAGSVVGLEWTEEQCNTAREAALLRWADEEQCQLVRETMLALWKDPEYRQMMLAANPALRKGFQHSDETKQKDREVMLERWKDPEYCQMQHDIQTGKRRTAETKRKISESHMGERNPNYGKRDSAETTRKKSEASLKHWADPKQRQTMIEARWNAESRRKHSEAHKKENLSDETRQRMSDARKRWWARKRMEESGGLSE